MLEELELEAFLVPGSAKGRRHTRALDVHLRMLHDYDPSHEAGRLNCQMFAMTWESQWKAATNSRMRNAGAGSTVPKYAGSDAASATAALRTGLLNGATYHITADMCGFIADVADTIPDDYTVDADSMPSPSGVMVLDVPIEVVDIHGTLFRVDTMWWQAGTEGWTVVCFTDRDACPATREGIDRHGIVAEEQRRAMAQKSMIWFNSVTYKDPILSYEAYYKQHGGRTFTTKLDPVTFEEEHLALDLSAEEDPGTHAVMSSLWIKRFVVASWAVMHGKIGRPRRGVPGRQHRKKIKAAGMQWGDIRIVDLRAVEYVDIGEDRPSIGHGVEWTHRWMVKGFWRWQWNARSEHLHGKVICPHCGKTGGFHKRIFVDPFVKGPEDLPYIAKDVVYAVRR